MFRDFFNKKAPPQPLSGAPRQPREKTYSAQSGYVYHYFYRGFRAAEAGEPATDFVFQISADRKNWRHTAVRQLHSAIAAWESSNQRSLASSERYAIAKLTLFQALDDRPALDSLDSVLEVGLAEIAAVVELLDL